MLKMKISHNIQVRTLQILLHILALIGLGICIYTSNYNYLVFSIIFYYVIGILGINVGYHRLLSHRSFYTHNFNYYILTILGCLTAMGSPIAWVSIHRQHHRHSDTDMDPHSPYKSGVIKSWLGISNTKVDIRNCKDLRKSLFHRYVHKNYIWIHTMYAVALSLIDPFLIFYIYAIPAVMIFHSAGALDVIAHVHGYRNYDTTDNSKNSWIANLLTMGEGWHNNHHANPHEWNTRRKWWEIDIPSMIIRLIKK